MTIPRIVSADLILLARSTWSDTCKQSRKLIVTIILQFYFYGLTLRREISVYVAGIAAIICAKNTGHCHKREGVMNILLIIGIILLVLWLLGFIAIPGLGWLINLALIIGVILIIIWLLKKVFKVF